MKAPRRKMAYPAYGMMTYKEIGLQTGISMQAIDYFLRKAARKLWRMGISESEQDRGMLQVAMREKVSMRHKIAVFVSIVLVALRGVCIAQSIQTAVSPPTTQIDLSVVNPWPGTVPIWRYVVSVGVTGSNGSFQPVAPVCMYVSQNGIGPAWDTTSWPSDTYTISVTLWLPPSTANIKSNCANITGATYGTASDYYTK